MLLVDDSRSARRLLNVLLTSWGYKVIEANCGREAMQVFRSGGISIILTDLHMADGDGWELIERVRREEKSYTYIIAITASEDKREIIESLNSGADDYLTKPFNTDELRARLTIAERIVRLKTQDLLIFTFAKLAEYRSQETGNHLERVEHYTRALCSEIMRQGTIPLTEHLAEHVTAFSCLHDIGKVGIPDHILNKPGKLTTEEFEIMKRHSTIGGKLVEDLYGRTGAESLVIARDIIIHHHEKWNGAGYPQGMAGEDIPLPARIIALADVYDALSSKRVYKNAFDRETCWKIILDEQGKHFDPDIVQAFLSREEEFWSICMELKD